MVGIYGVLSQSVSQRTQEIGVRMALGADRGVVLKMILKQGLVLTSAGIAVGLCGAFALTRLLSSLLFEIRPTDPPTFALLSGILIAVAAVACYVPARRATSVNPIDALRC
jgi:putative ABC transport system permease protein